MVEELCNAANEGDVDEVRRLVARGANPNDADVDGNTPLHYASRQARLPVVEYLIGEAQVDANKPNADGRIALHDACSWCPEDEPIVEVVWYLVEIGGANFELQDDNGDTPLHLAASSLRIDTVRFLVEQQQANVNMKNKSGSTPLDQAIFIYGEDRLDNLHADDLRSDREAVISFLLPRTSSVTDLALKSFWYSDYLVDFGGIVLEKYALGRGLANAFRNYPIHTLLKEFPLCSFEAFRGPIELFPSSALSLQDEQGRLPIHVALTSWNGMIESVVTFLFEREPRSALARDPTTGLYPHETAAGLVFSNDDGSDPCWLDSVYNMFRSNPQRLLQSRSGLEGRWTDDEYDMMGRQKAKRPKTEHMFH